MRDKKRENLNIAVKNSLQAVKCLGNFLIAMKSGGNILSPFSFPHCPSLKEGGGMLFNSVHFSFFRTCAPVLVRVMGKNEAHGGKLNKKAFEMVEYLRKSG